MKAHVISAFAVSLLALSIGQALAGDNDIAAPAPAAQSASAQDNSTPPVATATDEKKTKKLEAVTVTGSLIPRAKIEGPSPITTITAKDIDQQGFNDTFDALR